MDIDKVNEIAKNTEKEFTMSFCNALIEKTSVLESIAKDLGYKYDFSNPSKNNSEESLVIRFLRDSFSSIIAGSIHNIIRENILAFLTLDIKTSQALIDSLKKEDKDRFKFYNFFIEAFFEELAKNDYEENVLIINSTPPKKDILGSYKNYGFTYSLANDNVNTCYYLNLMKALKITPVTDKENSLLLDYSPINNFINSFVREKLFYLYSIKLMEASYSTDEFIDSNKNQKSTPLITIKTEESFTPTQQYPYYMDLPFWQRSHKEYKAFYDLIEKNISLNPSPVSLGTFLSLRLVPSNHAADQSPSIK